MESCAARIGAGGDAASLLQSQVWIGVIRGHADATTKGGGEPASLLQSQVWIGVHLHLSAAVWDLAADERR